MSHPFAAIQQLWTSLKTSNSFVQNSAFMLSASLSGIIIQLIFSPILSRIYSPDVYGLFSIFNSMAVVAGVFATLGYNRAFVLPREDSIFRALLRFGIRATWITGFLVLLITLIFGNTINSTFGSEDMGLWIWLLGPAIVLLSFDRMALDWSIRVKSFKKQSLISVPITLATKSFNALYGWLISSTVEGLIFTTMLHYLVRIVVYVLRIIPGATAFLRNAPNAEVRKVAREEYREYPRYIMWGNAIHTFSNYLPILVMPLLLDSSRPAGLLVYAGLILDLPARLMNSAISPVFLQKATETHHRNPEELGALTRRLYWNLLFISAVPLLILFVVGAPLYGWVFGAEWTEAGAAAEILSVYFLYRLIGSPISSIFNVLRKEKQAFGFQIVLFLFKLAALIVGGLYTDDFLELVVVFSIANGLTYALLIGWVFALLRQPVVRILLISIAVQGALLTGAYYLKLALFA
ncbi:MAG: hypothetical protein KDC12_08200 [Flavobacteriales bacterium]|nr:hypothetical protein [Flavobacteriales bacterium]